VFVHHGIRIKFYIVQYLFAESVIELFDFLAIPEALVIQTIQISSSKKILIKIILVASRSIFVCSLILTTIYYLIPL